MISIISVTYNAAQHIEKTIKSVISQSYTDIQYIIIDGNSTDDTISIIKKYDKYISYWESSPDIGIYDAMNKAVLHAKGDWINFMNAGDVFCNTNTIEKVMKHIQYDFDIVCGDSYIINTQGIKTYAKASGLDNIWNSVIPCNHQSMFVKKHLLNNFPFDLHYEIASDYEFIVKQYIKGSSFYFLDFPICNFLTGGISQTNTAKLQIESLMVLSKYAPNLKKNLSNNIHLSRLATLLSHESKYETFSQNFNHFFAEIEELQKNYKNIVVYGAGSIGKVIANILSDTVTYIVDRGDIGSSINNIPVIKPEQLREKTFNLIIISLVGREAVIKEYLTHEIGIASRKIYTLNI